MTDRDPAITSRIDSYLHTNTKNSGSGIKIARIIPWILRIMRSWELCSLHIFFWVLAVFKLQNDFMQVVLLAAGNNGTGKGSFVITPDSHSSHHQEFTNADWQHNGSFHVISLRFIRFLNYFLQLCRIMLGHNLTRSAKISRGCMLPEHLKICSRSVRLPSIFNRSFLIHN